jgi:hypothetical protein
MGRLAESLDPVKNDRIRRHAVHHRPRLAGKGAGCIELRQPGLGELHCCR